MTATRRRVVSIYGPAGSGKSQLAKALAERLGPDRCARIPTDYFLVPATLPLARFFAQPLQYDWELLARVLALPEGSETTTPDFDFATFQRRGETGGRPLRLRRLMVADAMEPYPASDLTVLLTAPDEVRHSRIARRDTLWQSRVHDRWHNLELTWRRVAALARPPDLTLDGTRPLARSVDQLAAWLTARLPDLA